MMSATVRFLFHLKNATLIQVLSCALKKLNIFCQLQAIHQIRAVMRSGEYRP